MKSLLFLRNFINKNQFGISIMYLISLFVISKFQEGQEYHHYIIISTMLLFTLIFFLGHKLIGIEYKNIAKRYSPKLDKAPLGNLFIVFYFILTTVCLFSFKFYPTLFIPSFGIWMIITIPTALYGTFIGLANSRKNMIRTIFFTNLKLVVFKKDSIYEFSFNNLKYKVSNNILTLEDSSNTKNNLIIDLSIFRKREQEMIINDLNKL